MKKTGLIRFKTMKAFLSCWWQDMMNFVEQKKYGILVNLDFEAFKANEGYTDADVSFEAIED